MPRIKYAEIRMTPVKIAIIEQANAIIDEFARIGLDLTLRQLYYQFVSREWFHSSWADPTTGSKNNEKSYKKLGDIIGEARMAGMIDWNAITDRTRNLRKRAEWADPPSLIDVCAKTYRIDRWSNQAVRPEIWIEKDALVGVIENPCEQRGVSYFSCRGYTSMSEIWVAAQRIGKYIRSGQKVVVFHLGDHDPSGVDMSRDIWDRLFHIVMRDLIRTKWLTRDMAVEMDEEHAARKVRLDDGDIDPNDFEGQPDAVYPFRVCRIALTMEQIREYSPPPNPAKLTDSRARKYVEKYGDESWELDALDPRTIVGLVDSAIISVLDPRDWRATEIQEEKGRKTFEGIKNRFSDVEKLLEG